MTAHEIEEPIRMPKVFISYRRVDASEAAFNVYRALSEKLGKDSVFIDIDDIPFGADFREHINKWISRADIVLVVIGNHWLESRDEQNERRLCKADDVVRVEIETALRLNKCVVPVLVGHAGMPSPAALPESLESLAFRYPAELRAGPEYESQLQLLVGWVSGWKPEGGGMHVVGRHLWGARGGARGLEENTTSPPPCEVHLVLGKDSGEGILYLDDIRIANLGSQLMRLALSAWQVSLAYPSCFARGYSSRLVVSIYLPKGRRNLLRRLDKIFGKEREEAKDEIAASKGDSLRIRIESPAFQSVSPDQQITLDSDLNLVTYIAKPEDNCRLGKQQGLLTIVDAKSGDTLLSLPFTILVVDYAVDHISRPLLSKAASVVLAGGSLLTFILTYLQHLDKTFGMTAGGATCLIAAALFGRSWALFERRKAAPATNLGSL